MSTSTAPVVVGWHGKGIADVENLTSYEHSVLFDTVTYYMTLNKGDVCLEMR